MACLRPHSEAQRGMAALTVVMVLFFVMALVAAYTNRNLIFEQRISANVYRGAKSMNATDAGIDWTVALLNGGRIDRFCRPSVLAADPDFRRRYLVDAPPGANGEGGYSVLAGAGVPACVNNAGALACICPSAADPTPPMAVPPDGSGSTFRVVFVAPGRAVRPGAIEFMSRGCATPGAGDTSCFAPGAAPPVSDAVSAALTTVGLVPALPKPPVATLTAGGTITAAAGTLNLFNTDAATGITAHAGGAISPSASINGQGPSAGTDNGLRDNDGPLATLQALPDDGFFRSIYGMDPTSYQFQPAAVRTSCTVAAPCTLATAAPLVAGYPRNVLWFNGDLNLNAAGSLGDTTNPVFLIVTGTLTISANVTIVGYVHAGNVVWSDPSNAASLRGAMMVTQTFISQSVATLSYDPAVMNLIRLRYGSFVRVPGSWNLTNPNTLAPS